MRCHHLDPRVLSYLPSQVSDQIENDIGKSRFSFGKVQQSKCFLLAFENISVKAKSVIRYCFETFSEDNSVN